MLLFALGSAGDVHPFVGLGLRLRERGHCVQLATSGYWRSLVERSGLGFLELQSREAYLELVGDPDLWRPLRGLPTLVRRAVAPSLEIVHRAAIAHHAAGDSLVVGSSLAFGARIAQETHGVRFVSVHLQPAMFLSSLSPPKLPGQMMGPRVPLSLKRLQMWAAEALFADPLLGRPIKAFRTSFGLKPARRIFSRWSHSPLGVVGMFPAWYAPPQDDWPPHVQLAGFPLYDEASTAPPPAEVEAFLAGGSPPIVFTPGSAMSHGQEFFAAAAEACQRLGRRGLLMTRFPEQLPPRLPPGVVHAEFAPFGWLLPRAAAIVHHGGIGTLSQGFAAGIPQLIMPMAHDQPDNAARAVRLGVAEQLARRKFQGPRVAAALGRLLPSMEVARSCREVADRLRGEDALGRACDLLESLAATPAHSAFASA